MAAGSKTVQEAYNKQKEERNKYCKPDEHNMVFKVDSFGNEYGECKKCRLMDIIA